MKPSSIVKLNHLDQTQPFLVAVSFGPDSMALLELLRTNGYHIRVAHVNYHKRPESDYEQEQLTQYCFRYDIPIDILDVQATIKGNFQAQARTIRYDFFLQLVKQHQLAGVITAHHLDDHLETATMQMKRGGYYPYYGIRDQGQWQDMKVYRPLLNLEKNTLTSMCEKYHVPYAIDASNQSNLYARNRVRQSLQQLSPTAKQALINQVSNLNQSLDEKKARVSSYIDKVRILTETYMAWDEETQFLYWYGKSQAYQLHFPISHGMLKKVEQAVIAKKPNIRLRITKEWLIDKSYHELWMIHRQWLNPIHETMTQPKILTLPMLTLDLRKAPLTSLPLICRYLRPQEVLKVGKRHKSFRRLAIDWKMPQALRKTWPAIVNAKDEVLLFPRYEKNQEIKANNWWHLRE